MMAQLEAHPAATAYPMMSEDELAYLVADMRANGYRAEYPVQLLDGRILDGRNRHYAADCAGVTPTFATLPDDTDAEAFVAAANENRRHLHEQELESRRRERVERVAQRRQAGESIRSIADGEKISTAQTRRDIEDARCAGGGTPEPKNVTGKDGKKYQRTSKKRQAAARARAAQTPAKQCERCQRVGATADCQTCNDMNAERGPKKAGPTTDAEGHVCHVVAAQSFANLPRFAAIDTLCRQLQKEIDELSRLPGGEQLLRCLQPTGEEGKTINKSEHLNALKRDLRGTRPHAVCPWCLGSGAKGCKGCAGHGWVTATTWKDVDMKLKSNLRANTKASL